MNIYVKMQYYPNQECKHIDHHNQEPHKHIIAFTQTHFFIKHTHKPTMMKPTTRMISDQNLFIIDKDEETALLLGTTILPQPTNNSDDHELPSVVESCYCCRYGDDACGGRWHGLVQGCVVS